MLSFAQGMWAALKCIYIIVIIVRAEKEKTYKTMNGWGAVWHVFWETTLKLDTGTGSTRLESHPPLVIHVIPTRHITIPLAPCTNRCSLGFHQNWWMSLMFIFERKCVSVVIIIFVNVIIIRWNFFPLDWDLLCGDVKAGRLLCMIAPWGAPHWRGCFFLDFLK